MILIFDATPLIYLAKARLLGMLERIPGKKIIAKGVFDEVVGKGIEQGHEDAILIEKLVKERLFEVMEPKFKKFQDLLLRNPNLHKADAETLALAKELNGIVLIDEESARSIAEIEGIKVRGSIYLLFLLLKNKKITKKELRGKLDEMISQGWRCSTELYALVLKELE